MALKSWRARRRYTPKYFDPEAQEYFKNRNFVAKHMAPIKPEDRETLPRVFYVLKIKDGQATGRPKWDYSRVEKLYKKYNIVATSNKKTSSSVLKVSTPKANSGKPSQRRIIKHTRHRIIESIRRLKELEISTKDEETLNKERKEILQVMFEYLSQFDDVKEKKPVQNPTQWRKGVRREEKTLDHDTAEGLRQVKKPNVDIKTDQTLTIVRPRKVDPERKSELKGLCGECAQEIKGVHHKTNVGLRGNTRTGQNLAIVSPHKVNREFGGKSASIKVADESKLSLWERISIASATISEVYFSSENSIELVPQLMPVNFVGGTIDKAIKLKRYVVNSVDFLQVSSLLISMVVVIYLIHIIFVRVNFYIDGERRYLAKMECSGLVMKCVYYVMHLLGVPIL